jgi:hypothetical protein
MAISRFILQGLDREDDHIAGLEQVFDLNPIDRGLVATAFMNSAGASLLVSMLEYIEDRVDVFVGIRNGVTSKQAIETLMRNGIFPYIVDTASQAYIFHPKVYITNNADQARLIVGSANATAGGMAKNVEASLYSELSMDTDHELVHSVYSQFETLKQTHPENVFRISLEDLDQIAAEGLLVDETRTTWSASARVRSENRADTRQRMRLRTRNLPRPTRMAHTLEQVETVEGTEVNIATVANNNLLWKSGKLTRRDLNIPTGATTNRTGSMLLKKGDASQDIDQRFYFRQEVFATQNWAYDQDPRYSHMERCTCSFRFVIKGIDYGIYSLKLSHNTRTDTKTFAQRNSMTQIHWGPALPLVAREDLLDSICSLYAPDENGVYTLVFDDE